jgi:hypothetical protein
MPITYRHSDRRSCSATLGEVPNDEHHTVARREVYDFMSAVNTTMLER